MTTKYKIRVFTYAYIYIEVHLPRLPALVFSEVLPSCLGRRGEGEVDVASHVPVVLVLINQFRNEFRSEGDQEPLKNVFWNTIL